MGFPRGESEGVKDQANNISLKRQHGTKPTYTLKRLKRDRPDLAERVVAGEMSADPVDPDQRSRRQKAHPAGVAHPLCSHSKQGDNPGPPRGQLRAGRDSEETHHGPHRSRSGLWLPPDTPEEQEDLLIIARELLRAVPTFLPERRLWAEEKLADVERRLDGREGPPAGSARRKKIEETISKVRGDAYDGIAGTRTLN